MNTCLKMASAAMLSVAAVSVAALSVPAVKNQALKLLDEFNGETLAVENITVKSKSIPFVPASKVGEMEFNGAALLKVIAPEDNPDSGVAGSAGASAGSGAEDASNNEDAGRDVPGVAAGGSSRGGGQVAGGRSPSPAESGAPGEQVIASTGGVGGGGPGSGPDAAPPLNNAAPGGPGLDGMDSSIPVDEVVEGIADLSPAPGNGLGGNDPVIVGEFAPIAALDESPSAIPEPGTLTLLGIAMLGLGALRRRRAQR